MLPREESGTAQQGRGLTDKKWQPRAGESEKHQHGSILRASRHLARTPLPAGATWRRPPPGRCRPPPPTPPPAPRHVRGWQLGP